MDTSIINNIIAKSEIAPSLREVIMSNSTGLLNVLFGKDGKYTGPFANGNVTSQEWITFCILISTWVSTLIPQMIKADLDMKASDLANLTIDLVLILINNLIIPFNTEQERKNTVTLITLGRSLIVVMIIQNIEKIDGNLFSSCILWCKGTHKKTLVKQSVDLANKAKILETQAPPQ